MATEKRHRKRRSDRNHVIYLATCKPTGDTYVGMTVARGRAYQASMMLRWKGHISHATVELRPYPIHQAIRENGSNKAVWAHTVLCIVRGKKAAHAREKTLITEFQPSLNVECTGRKNLQRVA